MTHAAPRRRPAASFSALKTERRARAVLFPPKKTETFGRHVRADRGRLAAGSDRQLVAGGERGRLTGGGLAASNPHGRDTCRNGWAVLLGTAMAVANRARLPNATAWGCNYARPSARHNQARGCLRTGHCAIPSCLGGMHCAARGGASTGPPPTVLRKAGAQSHVRAGSPSIRRQCADRSAATGAKAGQQLICSLRAPSCAFSGNLSRNTPF